MITPVKRTKFTNKKTVGKYAKISFDTYLELAGGKEDIYNVEANVHYFEKGTGKVLLMLHGVTQSYYTFRHNQTELSKHFRVIMPDLLGHGYSDCPDIAYTVEEYSLSLQAFLNGIGADRVSIVAFGQAAAYALDFTSYNSEWVEELVLIHPGAFAETNFPSAKMIGGPLGGHTLAKYAKPVFMKKCMEKAYFDKTIISDNSIEEYARPFTSPDVRSAVRLAVANYDNQFMNKIGSIQKKILVISSQDDTVHNEDSMHDMISHMQDAYSLVVRNCGYLPHEEKSETINGGILEFIQK